MLQRQKDGAEIFSSTTAMRDRWIMVMLFMYMGDLLASTANDSRKARLLADGIRVIIWSSSAWVSIVEFRQLRQKRKVSLRICRSSHVSL